MTKDVNSIEWQGHRGARGLIPENTIPSFFKALEFEQVSTLELDVVISADQKVIISHEPWFSHEICSYPSPNFNKVRKEEEDDLLIYKMTYEEIKKMDCGAFGNERFPEQHKMNAYKPSLKEMVEAIREHCLENDTELPKFNIEIKSYKDWYGSKIPPPAEFVSLVIAELKDLEITSKVCLQSFDPEVVKEIKKQAPDITLSFLSEKVEFYESQIESLGFKPDIYSPYFKNVTKKMLDDLHSQQIKVIVWTVNEVHQMEALIRMGVDGIITDYPNKISEVQP